MSNDSDAPSKFNIWWKPVSVGTLIAAVPIVMALNQSYERWHDVRYPRRTEVMMLAQANELAAKVQHAHETSESNTAKLDFLVKRAARDEIRQLKEDISEHKEQRDDSALWRLQLVQMENQLEGAQNYFKCITAKRTNCESER